MKKALLLLGLLALIFVAHSLSQYMLFSLFQASISIPLMIMLVTPIPTVLAALAFVFLELFSSLPQGSMLFMFLIPYLVLLLWKNLKVDLSWKFLAGTTLIVTLQSAALLCIVALTDLHHALQIPWHIILVQILITSFGTFALSFIYHEYSERL
jgi:hypothetical protein